MKFLYYSKRINKKRKRFAKIYETSTIFATHGMHVPLDIYYCDIDQQQCSLLLGLYRRYTITLLSRWSICDQHTSFITLM